MDTDHNGGENAEGHKVSQLVITYDRETGRVTQGGQVRNLLEAVLMLHAALLDAEYSWRKVRAREDAQSVADSPMPFIHLRHGRQ